MTGKELPERGKVFPDPRARLVRASILAEWGGKWGLDSGRLADLLRLSLAIRLQREAAWRIPRPPGTKWRRRPPQHFRVARWQD